jgi:hypothetical protein
MALAPKDSTFITMVSNAMKQDKLEIEPDPVIEAYKKDIDRTLIRENLRLTVEERFERLIELQRFAEELRRAGRKQKPLR